MHESILEMSHEGMVALSMPRNVHSTVRYQFPDILSRCPHLDHIIRLAQKAANLEANVLLFGESGTGKELFAQAIHAASSRAQAPFIAINCSSIPENLLESELFGYEPGAFTGADKKGRAGKFEAAQGGTVFLDEIGDMSFSAQAALLRVLQEKQVTRIGANQAVNVDVRIIAATHRNLSAEIDSGRFRTDLYYRLQGIQLRIPPLRERSDIGYLLDTFVRKLANELDCVALKLSPGARKLLEQYKWPGNVRECKNLLKQASFLSDGGMIEVKHCLPFMRDTGQSGSTLEHVRELNLKVLEKQAILQSLTVANGNMSAAAKMLGIGRNTLYRKMKRYGLDS